MYCPGKIISTPKTSPIALTTGLPAPPEPPPPKKTTLGGPQSTGPTLHLPSTIDWKIVPALKLPRGS